jgi:hypothetical protein
MLSKRHMVKLTHGLNYIHIVGTTYRKMTKLPKTELLLCRIVCRTNHCTERNFVENKIVEMSHCQRNHLPNVFFDRMTYCRHEKMSNFLLAVLL